MLCFWSEGILSVFFCLFEMCFCSYSYGGCNSYVSDGFDFRKDHWIFLISFSPSISLIFFSFIEYFRFLFSHWIFTISFSQTGNDIGSVTFFSRRGMAPMFLPSSLKKKEKKVIWSIRPLISTLHEKNRIPALILKHVSDTKVRTSGSNLGKVKWWNW